MRSSGTRSARIASPAKINLHLEIGLRREDGFHDLLSLFSMVDLEDELRVTLLPEEPGRCSIDGNFSFSAEENLICKAYRAYSAAVGFRDGIRVEVYKRIPEQTGLGGGSSNAAAMLKLLNCRGLVEEQHGGQMKSGQQMHGDRLCSDRERVNSSYSQRNSGILSQEKLRAVAASVGSDVPFFLEGPLSMVGGRGERLKNVEVRSDMQDFTVLLVFPPIKVSTAEAYRRLDLKRSEKSRSDGDCKDDYYNDEHHHTGCHPEGYHLSAEAIAEAYHRKSPGDWPFFNSFSEVLTASHPVYERVFNLLYVKGALYSEISGSGSAMFALYESKKTAEIAEKEIKKIGINTRKVKMLASCPEAVYNI